MSQRTKGGQVTCYRRFGQLGIEVTCMLQVIQRTEGGESSDLPRLGKSETWGGGVK